MIITSKSPITSELAVNPPICAQSLAGFAILFFFQKCKIGKDPRLQTILFC